MVMLMLSLPPVFVFVYEEVVSLVKHTHRTQHPQERNQLMSVLDEGLVGKWITPVPVASGITTGDLRPARTA
jgi:hypothetical protein